MTYSTTFIGKTVTVTIDRPLGAKHPKFNFIYPINYGYLPKTIAPDGEEIDAYILVISKPLKTFRGTCIAVIHRTDDEDDKLIVVPEGMQFTDKQIQTLTEFQEKFFTSIIIRK